MGICHQENGTGPARDVSAISINPNQTKAHRARWLRLAVVGAALLRSALLCTWGQDNDSALAPPKFLGAPSCGSSSCHGGAGANRDQFLVWSKYDYHHARPYSTLETARAEHIADAFKLGDSTRSAACTAFHAPLPTI